MRALTRDSVVGEPLSSIFHDLAERIAAASRNALEPGDVTLSPAPDHVDANFAFACFPLAKAWRANPAKIAGELAEALEVGEGDEVLSRVEAAGPYVNLTLRHETVGRRVLDAVGDESRIAFGDSERQADEVVMMEYVSPNTNKPLHLGHVRNAVLGRSVANLVASQGAKVWRSDIINDRGIHIAKSMVAYSRLGDGATPESTGTKGDHFVGRWYVEFDKALSEERKAWQEAKGVDSEGLDEREKKKLEEEFLAASEWMEEARDVLRRWEAEDPEVRELWRTMNQWVYAGFDETYERLGIDFDKHYYESQIYQGGREQILDAVERGVFERAENGAILAPLSKHEEALGRKLQDKVVLRADGTGLYITQDLNLAQIKFEEFGLTRSLYCIGSEQNYYMQQLAATLKLLGFGGADGVEHLSYGMVYLPEGKMKSREGNVVDADDLMREVTRLAADAVRERADDLDDDEIARRAEAIGLGAIVFDMLVVGRETDIQFDPKASVAFEGKTGPYLQYVYARISSILRNAGEWKAPETLELREDAERRLVSGLLTYPMTVTEAAESLDPSRLVGYLADEAQAFNRFYRDCPVLDAEENVRATRLALLAAFRRMIGHGLALLAIEPLAEM